MRYKNQPGVYTLIIKSPSKVYKYIGQSVQISKRISQHKNYLKQNKHYNTYMQNAYNQHLNLEFKVIYYPKEVLTIIEQTWINIIQCEDCECLNITPAKHMAGRKLTKEVKDKISASLKDNPQQVNKAHCVGKNHHSYIDTVHDFINIFTDEVFTGTRKEFMNKLGIHWKKCADVTALIQGKSKTCRGWALGKEAPKLSQGEWQGAYKYRPYIFIKGSERFEGTITEMRNYYNIKILYGVQRVVNGERNHTAGWKIRPLGK